MTSSESNIKKHSLGW